MLLVLESHEDPMHLCCYDSSAKASVVVQLTEDRKEFKVLKHRWSTMPKTAIFPIASLWGVYEFREPSTWWRDIAAGGQNAAERLYRATSDFKKLNGRVPASVPSSALGDSENDGHDTNH